MKCVGIVLKFMRHVKIFLKLAIRKPQLKFCIHCYGKLVVMVYYVYNWCACTLIIIVYYSPHRMISEVYNNSLLKSYHHLIVWWWVYVTMWWSVYSLLRVTTTRVITWIPYGHKTILWLLNIWSKYSLFGRSFQIIRFLTFNRLLHNLAINTYKVTYTITVAIVVVSLLLRLHLQS